jgi:TetR/AcrR family transcriptional repressor of nem operon
MTVEDVCARADVLRGSFYYFFDSKRTLAIAALQYFWKTVAMPAYDQHFSSANPPLSQITSFLNWSRALQESKFRCGGRVLGWLFFNLGCELGAEEPMITRQIAVVEADELSYFQSAICDALDQGLIVSVDPREEALFLQAAMEGILARARIFNDPEELSPLTTLPTNILRLKLPNVRDLSQYTDIT